LPHAKALGNYHHPGGSDQTHQCLQASKPSQGNANSKNCRQRTETSRRPKTYNVPQVDQHWTHPHLHTHTPPTYLHTPPTYLHTPPTNHLHTTHIPVHTTYIQPVPAHTTHTPTHYPPTNQLHTRVSFRGGRGGGIGPPCQNLAPPWKSQVAIFFQRVIGCNGYRTSTQHKEYRA